MSIASNITAPFVAKVLGVATGAALLASAGLYIWGDSWRDHAGDVQTKLEKLEKKATGIVDAVRQESGNTEVTLDTAAGQVVAMGSAYRSLKFELGRSNEAIDEMARKAVAAGKERDELARLLAKAKAQREGALRRLSDLSITPGTRSDCLQLLQEANEAADLLRATAKESNI